MSPVHGRPSPLGSPGDADLLSSGDLGSRPTRPAFFLLPQPIAVTLDVDGRDVMERAVEDRVGQDLVVEDLAPVREALVAGHDEAGPFVAADEEPEEEASLLPGQREVPELIQDEYRG